MNEIWKPIPGYEGLYDASNLGFIRSWMAFGGGLTSVPRLLALRQNKGNRYKKASLRKNGMVKNIKIHRLVLEAFVGPCPEGMEACHNDGNPMNNQLCNLRWDTHSSNMIDASNHGKRKATKKQVLEIKKSLKEGARVCDVARGCGLTYGMVYAIKIKHSWGWLQVQPIFF